MNSVLFFRRINAIVVGLLAGKQLSDVARLMQHARTDTLTDVLPQCIFFVAFLICAIILRRAAHSVYVEQTRNTDMHSDAE